ncbi:MAG: hypothetical protein ACK533_11285, partial [Planctomycetota bacterium]
SAYGEAVPQRSNGAIEAGKAGAVAALVRSMTTAIDGHPHTGAMSYAETHRDEAARHVAAIESDAGGFTPLGFTCSLRDEAAEAVRRALLPLQGFGAGAFLPGAGAGGADLGPLLALGVPCYGLVVDGQRYFDYHHAAVDDLPAVHERELALGAAAVAFAAWALADA